MPTTILKSVLGLALLFSTSTTATTTVSTDVLNKVVLYANAYHIDFNAFYKTINCESSFIPTQQSNFLDKNGKRELSFGLAQINLPYHPTVTLAEADDPDFALNFMANAFASGQQSQWTCYNLLKANGQI